MYNTDNTIFNTTFMTILSLFIVYLHFESFVVGFVGYYYTFLLHLSSLSSSETLSPLVLFSLVKDAWTWTITVLSSTMVYTNITFDYNYFVFTIITTNWWWVNVVSVLILFVLSHNIIMWKFVFLVVFQLLVTT